MLASGLGQELGLKQDNWKNEALSEIAYGKWPLTLNINTK